MKKLALLAVLVSTFSTLSARADLIGTPVFGTLKVDGTGPNLFNAPLLTIVPPAGSGAVFTGTIDIDARSILIATDTISVFFGTNLIVIEDKCTLDKPLAAPNACLLSPNFAVTLTDPVISQSIVIPLHVPPNFGDGGNIENTIFLDYTAGGPGNPGNDSFTDVLVLQPVPEPSSIVLLGTGLLGFAGTLRHRLRA